MVATLVGFLFGAMVAAGGAPHARRGRDPGALVLPERSVFGGPGRSGRFRDRGGRGSAFSDRERGGEHDSLSGSHDRLPHSRVQSRPPSSIRPEPLDGTGGPSLSPLRRRRPFGAHRREPGQKGERPVLTSGSSAAPVVAGHPAVPFGPFLRADARSPGPLAPGARGRALPSESGVQRGPRGDGRRSEGRSLDRGGTRGAGPARFFARPRPEKPRPPRRNRSL